MIARRRGRWWILIDSSLNQAQRRTVLAHELRHLETGALRPDEMPDTWRDIIVREERRIDQQAADLLVPADELTIYVDSKVDLGEPVEAWEVAEAFGVPDTCAALALDELRRTA